MFPLRAVPGGVRVRPGHTEAAVELCTLAGCAPVGVIAEVVHDAGHMMRLPDLVPFAAAHGCPLISIADLISYLQARDAAAGEAEGADPGARAGAGDHGSRAAAEHADAARREQSWQ
jgi:hypothetical protein